MIRDEPDLSKPCRACRWCSVGFVARFVFRDWSDALCLNPMVVENWHLNATRGWLNLDTMPPAIRLADPITGAPERRRILASTARGQQYARGGPGPFTPAPDAQRAPSNCGPDGRYWSPPGTAAQDDLRLRVMQAEERLRQIRTSQPDAYASAAYDHAERELDHAWKALDASHNPKTTKGSPA